MRERLDIVEAMMEHEAGTLSPARELELFAHLIRTGQAWHLEGHYGQLADYLRQA